MEFAEVVKQKQKMCDGAKNCEGCSLSHFNNGFQLYCLAFIEKHPEEAEKVIMRWAEEHPIKTNRQVLEEILKEKFGDIFDVSQFGCSQFKDRHCDIKCSDCGYRTFWDREYK